MNQEPFFTDTVSVLAVILMIPVFFLWLEKKTQWKIFQFLPAIIWIFLTPILLSNLGLIPRSTPIYTTFRSFAVPLFIVLMLLDTNIRDLLKVWRGAVVMVVGSFGIVIGAAVAFFALRSGLPTDAWSGFGALAGSWIGGTGNLAAVAESLNTPNEFVGVVVVVDNFVYLVYFPIILTSRHWAPWFNRFTRVSKEEIDRIANISVERKIHEVNYGQILTLLGTGFAAILAANFLARLMPAAPPVLTEKTWAMLLVTTIAVALSATPLKKVPGTAPLSMTFVYIYMTMIGASADLRELAGAGAQWFLVAGFVCIAVHFLIVVLGARLLRVDVSMAAVASVAAVGGMASAPIAAAFHRKELVPVAILLALFGYFLGNFLGVLTAQLCYVLA